LGLKALIHKDLAMAKKSKKVVAEPNDYDGLPDEDEFTDDIRDQSTGRLDRVFHVMRFSATDEEILRAHFAKFSTRHEALLALVPIIRAMDTKKPQPPKLKAMRIGLPKAFISAAKKIKRPMTQTIIDAAQQFAVLKGDSPLRQSEDAAE
jgi:hypothetical protein